MRCRATEAGQTAQVDLFEKDTAKATPLGTIDLSSAVWAFGGVPQPVIASPDGRRVVVTCQTEMNTTQWTVIDQAGTILATVPSP